VFEFRGDRRAVNTGSVANRSDQLAIIRINDVHLGAVRHVQASRSAVDGEIVKTTIAGYRIAIDHVVTRAALHEQHGY
jgi:hypothetical protein